MEHGAHVQGRAPCPMNHSERLGLELIEKTRVMMADPHAMMLDWSVSVVMLSLATLIFLFILLSSD